jgi:hypothetical protein
MMFFQATAQQTKDTITLSSGIVGIWQAKTSVISSALHENFQFFKTGEFIFNTDSYDDLNPLISISGHYIVENNILKLKIIQIRQRVGFKILEADLGFQRSPFQIKGGKIVTIAQKDTDYSEHEFEFVVVPKISDKKSIKIDEEQYFRLSNDPNRFVGK